MDMAPHYGCGKVQVRVLSGLPVSVGSGEMQRCFCGKPATHHVTVVGSESWKYCDCPRCEDCKDRAVRSYDEVRVTELKDEDTGA